MGVCSSVSPCVHHKMRIDPPAGVKLGRERLYKVSDASKEIGVLGEVHDEDNLWMRKKKGRWTIDVGWRRKGSGRRRTREEVGQGSQRLSGCAI